MTKVSVNADNAQVLEYVILDNISDTKKFPVDAEKMPMVPRTVFLNWYQSWTLL